MTYKRSDEYLIGPLINKHKKKLLNENKRE